MNHYSTALGRADNAGRAGSCCPLPDSSCASEIVSNRLDSSERNTGCGAWARGVVAAAVLSVIQGAGQAQQSWLDRLDERLSYQTPGGWVRADLSGLVDFEGYTVDQLPPGLVFSDREYLIAPRMSLFLDSRFGSKLYSLVQMRFDRGFDPNSKPRGDERLDEYFMRFTPWEDGRVYLQAGKFATVFGNWVSRHDSWNNPFVNAPLAYENVLSITDQAGPPGPGGFLSRKAKADDKAKWLPILWGPSYAAGALIGGSYRELDYAFEFKNASVSSRPVAWDPVQYGWEDPTWSGRLGWRPNATWNLGMSGSYGGYLLPSADPTLPPGMGREDYQQTTFGFDAHFARHRWLVWSEVIGARFDVPNVGHADTLSYYVEAKYKFDAMWFGSLRWNQQFFGEVTNPAGVGERWDHDMWRAEAAVGLRFTRHWQAKVQYSYGHQNGPLQQGEQMFAGQVTLKF